MERLLDATLAWQCTALLAMVLSDVIRTDKEVCLRLFSGCPEHGLGLFHFHEAGKGVLQVAVQLVWQAADDLDFSY